MHVCTWDFSLCECCFLSFSFLEKPQKRKIAAFLTFVSSLFFLSFLIQARNFVHRDPMAIRAQQILEERERKLSKLAKSLEESISKETTFTPEINEYRFKNKVWQLLLQLFFPHSLIQIFFFFFISERKLFENCGTTNREKKSVVVATVAFIVIHQRQFQFYHCHHCRDIICIWLSTLLRPRKLSRSADFALFANFSKRRSRSWKTVQVVEKGTRDRSFEFSLDYSCFFWRWVKFSSAFTSKTK